MSNWRDIIINQEGQNELLIERLQPYENELTELKNGETLFTALVNIGNTDRHILKWLLNKGILDTDRGVGSEGILDIEYCLNLGNIPYFIEIAQFILSPLSRQPYKYLLRYLEILLYDAGYSYETVESILQKIKNVM